MTEKWEGQSEILWILKLFKFQTKYILKDQVRKGTWTANWCTIENKFNRSYLSLKAPKKTAIIRGDIQCLCVDLDKLNLIANYNWTALSIK